MLVANTVLTGHWVTFGCINISRYSQFQGENGKFRLDLESEKMDLISSVIHHKSTNITTSASSLLFLH